MVGNRLIIDGYNAIFRLTRAGRREDLRELRLALEARIREIGRERGERPWIVYDGQQAAAGGDSSREEEYLRVSFIEPPAEADDFIVHVAAQDRREGLQVRVVTSDLRLAKRLQHQDVATMSVEEADRTLGAGVGVPRPALQAGDLREVEEHFLSLHRAHHPQTLVQRTPPAVAPALAEGPGPPPSPDAGRVPGGGEREQGKRVVVSEQEEARREMRRARGARKQQRRLQQAKGGRKKGKRR